MWRDARGRYHMLGHSMGEGAGLVGEHAFSADGVAWTQAPTPPYTWAVARADGTVFNLTRRERPQLVFDGASARPLALSAGAKPDCGSGCDFTRSADSTGRPSGPQREATCHAAGVPTAAPVTTVAVSRATQG